MASRQGPSPVLCWRASTSVTTGSVHTGVVITPSSTRKTPAKSQPSTVLTARAATRDRASYTLAVENRAPTVSEMLEASSDMGSNSVVDNSLSAIRSQSVVFGHSIPPAGRSLNQAHGGAHQCLVRSVGLQQRGFATLEAPTSCRLLRCLSPPHHRVGAWRVA